MQAMFVKLVLVDSVLRVFQPFALFQIEYVIAQTERGFDFLLRQGEFDKILILFRDNRRIGDCSSEFFQTLHTCTSPCEYHYES